MLFLRTVGWLTCVIYSTVPLFWLMVHPRAHLWRARAGSPFRLLLPMWTLMWIVLALLTWPWRHIVLYFSLWTWIPSVLLSAVGIFLYRRAGVHFSWAHLAGLPEVRPNHNEYYLVTTGIRARVRHPV